MNQKTTIVLVVITVLLVGALAYIYGRGNPTQSLQETSQEEQANQEETTLEHEDENVEKMEEGLAESCSTNSDCSSSMFCAKGSCSDEKGICAPKPDFCAAVVSPICGCDNSTYQNSCEALRAGVNVNEASDCSFL